MLPIYDQVLARKLFLECEPAEFFRVANVFPPARESLYRFRPDSRGFHENIFDLASAMLRQIGRSRRLRPPALELRIDESDFGRVFEFEVTLYHRHHRRFRMDCEHFNRSGWEHVLSGLMVEAVVYLRDEARARQAIQPPMYIPRRRSERDPF